VLSLTTSDSSNELKGYYEDSDGNIEAVYFQSRLLHDIDIGIADYLSKDLRRNLFESAAYNFSISRRLRDDIKTLVVATLKENQKTNSKD